VTVLGTRCNPRPDPAHSLLQAGTELSPRRLRDPRAHLRPWDALVSWRSVAGSPSCKRAPMCSSTPSCAALSTHSWPFVCSSERSLGVTRALPFGRRAGTRCLIEPHPSPSQGHAFGNVPFFSIIQLWVVLTCSAMLSGLTVQQRGSRACELSVHPKVPSDPGKVA